MGVLATFAVVAAVAFGLNLIPAFGPPTWALLVVLELNWDINSVVLVLAGAVGAATGRFVLATTTRHFRGRFSEERRENLSVVADRLTASRGRAIAGLGLFALSPVPSAQLFEAAGLLAVPLVPLTLAFFAGRLVSYSLYVAAAKAAEDTAGDVFRQALTSPWAIAIQVVLIAGLVALTRVDWKRVLDRLDARRARRRGTGGPADQVPP
jgi:uncharacterized membrane protein YdjX (TVP38/TMEM64 family)